MKKVLCLLMLSLSTIISFSQVDFESSLEMGYEDRRMAIYKEVPSYYFGKNLFSAIDASATWKRISLFTIIGSYFKPNSIASYTPVQAEYTLGLKYAFKSLEIKAEHMCSHSVDAKYYRDGWNRISVKLYLIK